MYLPPKELLEEFSKLTLPQTLEEIEFRFELDKDGNSN